MKATPILNIRERPKVQDITADSKMGVIISKMTNINKASVRGKYSFNRLPNPENRSMVNNTVVIA